MTFATAEFLKIWLIFSFSLGCWTCLNLMVTKRGDSSVKFTIALFIALLLLPSINAYVTLVAQKPASWLLILSHNLTWSYGPIILTLLNQILMRISSRLKIALHAIPFLVAYIHNLLDLQWLNISTYVALLFTQLFCYVAYAAYLLCTQKNRLLQLTAHHKNTTYYWMLYLIVGLLFLTLIDIGVFIAILRGHFPTVFFSAYIASLLSVYVNAIALFALYQPSVFFHEAAPEEPPQEESKSSLRSIELSPEAAHELDRQLTKLVHLHKPHLDENISLTKLASLLGVTTHQLSELLNIHKSTSFYDFLNDLRYQESLRFLQDDDKELTIADIAYRSGFNNRNSFYKVFKQKTGQTPSQYKKSAV